MSCGQWAVFTKLGGGAIRFASQPSQFIEQGSLTNEPNELPVFPILALSSSSSSSSSPSSSFPGIFPSDKIPQRCFLQWWRWGLEGSFHNHHKLVIFYIHVQLGKVVDNGKGGKSFQARAWSADGTPTVGRGKTFWAVSQIFFTETAVTPERKVEKWFPRWEINRHAEV